MNNILFSMKMKFKVSPLGVALSHYKRSHKNRGKKAAWKAMDRFGYGNLPESEKKKLYADMEYCAKKWEFSYLDYYNMGLKDKTDGERNEFISACEHVTICELLNKPENQKIFDDKTITAKVFAKYFKRETLALKNENDFELFCDFVKRHGRAIIKPVSRTCGKGVKMLTDADDLEQVFKTYTKGAFGGAIVEEVIRQDERMSRIHPQSVNTVRVTTITMKDRAIVFQSFFRAGQKDSIVDNGGSGGILCALDTNTGKILAAYDENNVSHPFHPDTNEPLVGFVIPEWDKAVELVNELVKVVPDNRHTGWDLALTENGWVLVEANARSQWVSQYSLKKGCRREVMQYLNELGIKY